MEVKMKEYSHIVFRKNWEIDNDISYMLGQCDSIVRTISVVPISPAYFSYLMSVSLKKGAIATTAIEGNTLSEEEVERIHQGDSLPPSKKYMEMEILNIKDALNGIKNDVLVKGVDLLISRELIEEYHRMVGRNLGDQFEAIPGKFRHHDVVVGSYRAPKHQDVPELVGRLCNWLRSEFLYEQGKQEFSDQIIQAIVTHVYIAMIHPFGDGNGRTARLLEFYILLRAGLPIVASHILSNHYNDTRSEYYRKLDACRTSVSLTEFIRYAVQGFRDGLDEVLETIINQQYDISWKNYIYEILDSKKAQGKSRNIVKRRRELALTVPVDKQSSIQEIMSRNFRLAQTYAQLTQETLTRDIAELIRLELVLRKGRDYQGNIDIMKRMMPPRKVKE